MSNYQHERGWLDSGVWGNAPYDERGAWSWMIGEAAWKDHTLPINGRPVHLLRGQFTASLRFMAGKFGWDKNKVDRYLAKLQLWQMITIGTENGTGQNIITICNYNTYQEKQGNSGQQTGQERDRSGTGAGQTRSPSNPSIQVNTILSPREMFRVIFDEGSSAFPNLATRRTTVIDQWIEAGAVPADVLGEISRAAERRVDVRSWGYFTAGVMDSISTRNTPLPHGTPRGQPKEKQSYSDKMREAGLRGLQEAGGFE